MRYATGKLRSTTKCQNLSKNFLTAWKLKRLELDIKKDIFSINFNYRLPKSFLGFWMVRKIIILASCLPISVEMGKMRYLFGKGFNIKLTIGNLKVCKKPMR